MTSKIQHSFFLLCLLFTIPQVSLSQTRDTLLERLIHENSIQYRECYNTVIFDGKISPLSILTSKMTFDDLGRPTNYTTYEDSLEVSSFLVYFYNQDNNLVKAETRYSDKDKNHTTTYNYNENGLISRERNVLEDKMNAEACYNYNEMGLLKELKVEFFDTKKSRKQSILYDYNQKNQLIKTTFKTHLSNVLEQEYDTNGNVVRIYHIPRKKSKILFSEKGYNDKNQIISQKNYAYQNQSKFDGINNISIKKGDISILKIEYFENGLIANETEWLNGILVSFREFEYLKNRPHKTDN